MGRVFYLSKSKLVIQACITHSSGTLLGEGIQFFLSGLEFKKKKKCRRTNLRASLHETITALLFHFSKMNLFCFISSALELGGESNVPPQCSVCNVASYGTHTLSCLIADFQKQSRLHCCIKGFHYLKCHF